MLQVSFDYEINGKLMKVTASCKSVIDGADVEDLYLSFFDEDDNRIKIEYDADLFEDLEGQALDLLAESYYNPELNFSQGN